MKSTSSLQAWIIKIGKSVLGVILDEINIYFPNGFFQWVTNPYSMQFHPLWHGPNGPMANFQAITSSITVLECRSNGHIASNYNIDPPWRSSILCYTDITTKFKFWKPSFCEVLSGASCKFSNLAFFLLRFLAFFPMI
jgi:hypothetical protein